MSKRKSFIKIFVILGMILLVAGVAVFVGGMTAGGWDFSILSTVRYEQKSYDAEGDVTSLRIEYCDASISVEYSETAETVHIDYPVRLNERGEETAQITIAETDGVLTLTERRDWQDSFLQWNIDLDFGGDSARTVHVVLPAGQNIALDLYTQNGSVSLEADGETLPSLSLRSDNGNVSVSGVLTVAGSAAFQTDNGNIDLTGTVSAKEMTASTDFGDITMRSGTIDAQEITMTTEFGNITAEGSAFAGAQSDYAVQVSTDMGESNVSDSPGGSRKLTLSTDMGDIRIFFQSQVPPAKPVA